MQGVAPDDKDVEQAMTDDPQNQPPTAGQPLDSSATEPPLDPQVPVDSGQLSAEDLATLSSQLAGEAEAVPVAEPAARDPGDAVFADAERASVAAAETPPVEPPPVLSNTLVQAELDALADQLGAAYQPRAAKPVEPVKQLSQAELAALTAGTQVGSAAPEDDPIAQAMAAAIAEEAAVAAAQVRTAPVVVGATTVRVSADEAQAFEAPELGDAAPAEEAPIDLLDDVQLDVQIELGRAHMYIEDVLKLGVGSVVELDKLAGDPVDIFVNGKLIAHGEVLVLNDNFCVRINDIQCPVPELGQA